MAAKYLDSTGLAYFWEKIKAAFGISIDAQTIALYAALGWDPPSDSTTDTAIDQSTIDLYESLGWSEE